MDMEGFAADATNLRKMLTSIDRKLHEMRLIDRCQGGGRGEGRAEEGGTHIVPVYILA